MPQERPSPPRSPSPVLSSPTSPPPHTPRNGSFEMSGPVRRSREYEPLLETEHGARLPEQSPEDEDVEYASKVEREKSKSTLYLILLTISIGGLQIAWAVELGSISPFLLSLGISKAVMALVWIAGPLGGALVQPLVGIWSDDCRLKWGRRRPFIVSGAIATSASLLLLAWTRETVGGFLSIFGASPDSHGVKVCSQIYAVILVYVLDFFINVIQAGIRALIVDCAPTHQQDTANAWANRIVGVGSILGYLSGYVYLPDIFSFLGHTQFQVLCAIATIAMAVTVSISSLFISEEDPHNFGEPSNNGRSGVVAFFKTMYKSIRRLPPQAKRVCLVQLFAWIGWFPFLFYTSVYVGNIYAEPFFRDNPNLSDDEVDAILDRGTREGSFTLLIFAITTFVFSVLLPIVIPPSYSPVTSSAPSWTDKLRIKQLTLRRAWQASHVLFFVLTWCTFFVRSTAGATALIAFVGIPWCLTNWAPFALIANEVSNRDAIRRGLRPADAAAASSLTEARDADGVKEQTDQAGVVLGIHNVAIAAPQVIATIVSSVLFKLLQKQRGQAGDDSVAWVMRVGGVCALMAAWCCRYVREPGEEVQLDETRR